MRVVFILLFVILFSYQNAFACSCYNIPSFEYTVSSIDKDSSVLILGELSEFLEFDSDYPAIDSGFLEFYSDFPSSFMINKEQYKYVTINVIKDYIGNNNSKQVVLLNGPSSSCIQSFSYPIGSQLIILAKQTDNLREEKQTYLAHACLESTLYYDRENNIVRGNITPYNSFLMSFYSLIYDLFGIYRYPQDQMTLEQVEQVISRSLN